MSEAALDVLTRKLAAELDNWKDAGGPSLEIAKQIVWAIQEAAKPGVGGPSLTAIEWQAVMDALLFTENNAAVVSDAHGRAHVKVDAFLAVPPAATPSAAAIQAAERAYWLDDGASIHNMAAALRAAYAVDFGAGGGPPRDKT